MAHPARLTPVPSGALVLVRHGESEYIVEGRFQGRHDPPLSALGERQAALVADRLGSPGVPPPLPVTGPAAAIFHSPLRRAARTAEWIASRQHDGLPVAAVPELTEIAQGEWEGLPHADVAARWPELLAAWRADPTRANAPGGERLLDAADRVERALAAILAVLPGAGERAVGTRGADAAAGDGRDGQPWVAVVAHDGILRLALLALLGVPSERFWSFPFALGAITVVSVSAGVGSLRAHNLTDHLAPLMGQSRAEAEARGDRRGAL